MNRDKKYALLAVIGAFLLWAAVGGICTNCRGIFFNPVATALDIPLSTLNLAGILSGIASALTIPPFCRLYHKSYGKLFLWGAALTYCLAQFLLGYTASAAWFYAMTILQGVSTGFINAYVIQAVASAWFPNKKGTVLGIIALSPSLTGIVMNPLITGWIESLGWQTAYRITGIVVLALVSVSLCILRHEPAAAGCKPILSGITVEAAAPPAHATKWDVLLVMVCICVIAMLNALPQHLANYAVLANLGAVFGASLVSLAMIGSLLGKILIGPLNDRIGARATSFLIFIPIIAASLALLSVHSPALMCLCAFFIGLVMPLSALQIPLLCRSCLTAEMYLRCYPVISSVNVLLTSSSAGILSFLLGINGTYSPVLLVCVGLLILSCFAVILLEISHRRHAVHV